MVFLEDSLDYVIRSGKMYRTVDHPLGWSDVPDFEIGSDGGVYMFCTAGTTGEKLPVYEFKNLFLYRTGNHPKGLSTEPDYYISD